MYIKNAHEGFFVITSTLSLALWFNEKLSEKIVEELLIWLPFALGTKY